jgi:hypothetical protein
MGEYATYCGHEIKIGTCESMYYLRYEDRFKVQPVPNSINPHREYNLHWRLPFPDEDNMGPGYYDNHNRGVPFKGDIECNGCKGTEYNLVRVKNLKDGTFRPIIECRKCRKLYSWDWEDMLPLLEEGEFKERLCRYTVVMLT